MQVFKTKIIFLLLIFGTLFVHSVLLTKTFFYCVDTFSTISPYLSEQTQLVLVSSAVFQWLTTWPAERFHSTSWCTQSFPVLMCSSRTSGNKQKISIMVVMVHKHFWKSCGYTLNKTFRLCCCIKIITRSIQMTLEAFEGKYELDDRFKTMLL